ncbi:MAG: hypothetical protein ACREQ9_17810 [Candidatus Binatia bacterium]
MKRGRHSRRLPAPRPLQGLRDKLSSESGQGMTEYIIVFVSLLVPLFALLEISRNAITRYMTGVYSYLSFPFP